MNKDKDLSSKMTITKKMLDNVFILYILEPYRNSPEFSRRFLI